MCLRKRKRRGRGKGKEAGSGYWVRLPDQDQRLACRKLVLVKVLLLEYITDYPISVARPKVHYTPYANPLCLPEGCPRPRPFAKRL